MSAWSSVLSRFRSREAPAEPEKAEQTVAPAEEAMAQARAERRERMRQQRRQFEDARNAAPRAQGVESEADSAEQAAFAPETIDDAESDPIARPERDLMTASRPVMPRPVSPRPGPRPSRSRAAPEGDSVTQPETSPMAGADTAFGAGRESAAGSAPESVEEVVITAETPPEKSRNPMGARRRLARLARRAARRGMPEPAPEIPVMEDFDLAEDALGVVYDPERTPDPQVKVVPVVGTSDVLVMLDGQPLMRVRNGAGVTMDDVALIEESDAPREAA